MAYNLASPNGIAEKVDLGSLPHWFARELDQVKTDKILLCVMRITLARRQYPHFIGREVRFAPHYGDGWQAGEPTEGLCGYTSGRLV